MKAYGKFLALGLVLSGAMLLSSESFARTSANGAAKATLRSGGGVQWVDLEISGGAAKVIYDMLKVRAKSDSPEQDSIRYTRSGEQISCSMTVRKLSSSMPETSYECSANPGTSGVFGSG